MSNLISAPSALALIAGQLRISVEECGIRSLTESDILCIAERALLPQVTDPVTGFLNGVYRMALLREAQQWSEKTGKPVYYVEFDVRNLGGGNAKLGHQKCNEMILRSFATMITCAVHGLVNQKDCWSVHFRHGGDEFSALIGGVSNDREAGRPLTRTLDTLVRASHEYASSAMLDTLPHPKHLFRFSRWGTGLTYGFASVDPDRDPREIFSEADCRVEQYKRGLAPGAPYPLKLTWAKRREMFWILLQHLAGRR